MSQVITSLQNQKIKEILLLRERKGRGETRLTLVEGAREVKCAMESGVVFKEIFLCPELFKKEKAVFQIPKNVSTFELSEKVFEKISFGERKEGILAVCEQPKFSFGDLRLNKNPFLAVVERIEKPGNLGAILRICDGAGVDGVIVCDGATDVYNPNVIRASLGTIFSVKTIQATNEEALNFLKKNNIQICAAVPAANSIYTQVNFRAGLAIVLGSEQEGLSQVWLKSAHKEVKIPMRGKADSLNVSATAAVLLYEVLRQRSEP